MILAELEYRATHRIESFYPETGPLRRELYRKHMDFFETGAKHNERLFLGGNRVGKSEGVGAYKCVLHLTGRYPAWWRGRRFPHPVAVWAAGKDAKTTRDILQLALLGCEPQFGTGMIPADLILGTTPKPDVPEGVETIYSGTSRADAAKCSSRVSIVASRVSTEPKNTSFGSMKNASREYTPT
jgi:hypothetical protein